MIVFDAHLQHKWSVDQLKIQFHCTHCVVCIRVIDRRVLTVWWCSLVGFGGFVDSWLVFLSVMVEYLILSATLQLLTSSLMCVERDFLRLVLIEWLKTLSILCRLSSFLDRTYLACIFLFCLPVS